MPECAAPPISNFKFSPLEINLGLSSKRSMNSRFTRGFGRDLLADFYVFVPKFWNSNLCRYTFSKPFMRGFYTALVKVPLDSSEKPASDSTSKSEPSMNLSMSFLYSFSNSSSKARSYLGILCWLGYCYFDPFYLFFYSFYIVWFFLRRASNFLLLISLITVAC